MHLIHLTYETPQFSLVYLKHAQKRKLVYTLGKNRPTQSILYNKVLNISCNLLTTVLEAKNRIVVRVQNGCTGNSYLPS